MIHLKSAVQSLEEAFVCQSVNKKSSLSYRVHVYFFFVNYFVTCLIIKW